MMSKACKSQCQLFNSIRLSSIALVSLISIVSFFIGYNVNSHIYQTQAVTVTSQQTSNQTNRLMTMAINAFPKQLHTNTFIHSPAHSLQYCYIPKNVCTKFKQLFYRLNTGKFFNSSENIHAKIGYNDRNNSFIPRPRNAAERLMNSDTWKSLVVLRDPLERLVSGFEDKCNRDHRHWCEGSKTTDFRVFARRIMRNIRIGKVFSINPHFRPQYAQCALEEYFDFYDYVIYFDEASIGEQTLSMMRDEGIEQIYFNWNGHQNETLFSSSTKHANKNSSGHSPEERGAFYSNYFDKEFANKVMNAFEKDYKVLGFKKPQWIEYLKN